MKRNYIFLLSIFFWIGLLQGDGFAAGTLVLTQQGFVPIEQCMIGNTVVAYANCELCACPVSHSTYFIGDRYIKITVGNEYICASPDQKFYGLNKNAWVCAWELEILDQLLCGNGEIVSVEAIEIVDQQQKMDALSVETNHIYCVGRYEVIAHNIEPVATTATMVLSVFCPPAAAAVAIGEAITFGVVGLVMYCAHKKLQKNKKKLNGCFSENSEFNKPHDCAMPKVLAEPTMCSIPIESSAKLNEIIPYEKSEKINVDCTFPIEVAQESVLHFEDTAKDDCDEKKQYDGPWYNRTEDWIKEDPFGQKIKKSLERSQHTNQGKRVFEVIKKIDECDGFNKGDYVVVDAMHKDHLEVFDRYGEWKNVANFNGTKNEKKTEQGKQEPRQKLKKQR